MLYRNLFLDINKVYIIQKQKYMNYMMNPDKKLWENHHVKIVITDLYRYNYFLTLPSYYIIQSL